MFFSRLAGQANDMFKKATPIAQRAFNTAKDIVSDVSRYSGQAGDILGQVANIGATVLNNNEVKQIAGYDPRLSRLYNAGQAGVQYAGLGSNLANQVSNLTNTGSYQSGNHIDNIKDAIQRGKNIKTTGDLVRYV